MINEEIAKLIAKNYEVDQPREVEIEKIIKEISRETTYNEMDSIINEVLNGNLEVALESIDMSVSINLLNQLLVATSQTNLKD